MTLSSSIKAHKIKPILLVASLLTISTLTALYVSPPNSKTPTWVQELDGNTWSTAIDANGSHIVVGTQTSHESGAVYYFDSDGNLLWRYPTDHEISTLAISSNGAYIAAGGFQQGGGPAGIYQNGEVYYLNNRGELLWRLSTGDQPVFKVEMSSNGSTVAASYATGFFYANSLGRILWNYSIAQSGSLFDSGELNQIAMSKDGSYIVAGEGGLRITGDPNFDWKILYLNSTGNVLWSNTGHDGSDVSSVAIEKDGSYIAAGVVISGSNGTLRLFNKEGQVLWNKQVYSDVLPIQISNGGSFISATTNENLLYYSQSGNLLWNYTGQTGGPFGTMTPDGRYVLGAAWGDFGPTALLFDSQGKVLWSYNAGLVHGSALSDDGANAVIVSGPAENGPSTIYYFSRTENGNLIAATMAWYYTTLQEPILLLVELVVGGAILATVSVVALRLKNRKNNAMI